MWAYASTPTWVGEASVTRTAPIAAAGRRNKTLLDLRWNHVFAEPDERHVAARAGAPP
jgi:hypothetical protein